MTITLPGGEKRTIGKVTKTQTVNGDLYVAIHVTDAEIAEQLGVDALGGRA